MNFEIGRPAIPLCLMILAAGNWCLPAAAQTPATGGATERQALEKRANLNLLAAKENPLALRHFLLGMPKGADLHNHLAGAIYAESWIRVAAEEQLCVDPKEHSLWRPPGSPTTDATQLACGVGKVPASDALKNHVLYDALVDAFSMRGYVPTPGMTGHDQFFSTFDKFQAVYGVRIGEAIDEVATRAAAQNEQYLELMHTPSYKNTATLARELGWRDDLASLRAELLKRGIGDDIAHAKTELDQAEQLRRRREHCGQTEATAACAVEVRYLCQVLRGLPKEVVFAQTLSCFELASTDPRYVGLNFVQPEDGYTAMNDYALQMRMLNFLHSIYRDVHISLHAGELAPGLVPYEELCCHIRLAVDQAHAERVGHAVDIMYEDHPHELLREMAAKHVMVELNLTSNEVILGVSGKEGPLPIYRQFHVPVGLSTDDEGVLRIDLTHEYVRAVQTYGLSYSDLKEMVRTGMEHSFLPGQSLWAKPDDFRLSNPACSSDPLGNEKPTAQCNNFLLTNEKARSQWELERRFHVFERSL